MPVVTVFGGSHFHEGEPEYEKGRLLGKSLAEADFTVCNGGYGGMMEATARGAKEGGGATIGVTTKDFGGPANRWVDREIRMEKWSERLFKLIELGDAYVLFDGGTGTLVELFVVWEMSNKKFLNKPIVILGNELQDLLERVRRLSQVVDNPNIFSSYSPAEVVQLLKQKTGAS